MNYVDNYEDAKRFIEQDIDGAFDAKLKKTAKFRALLMMGLGNAALLGAAIATKDYSIVELAPAVILWATTAYQGVLIRYFEKMWIESGSYFKGKTHEEIIAQANKQIEVANDRENKKRYIPLYEKSEISKKKIILNDPSAEKIWEKK